jgi:putative alpha-1,2-mannosidase
MYKKASLLVTLILASSQVILAQVSEKKDYTQYVNPFIGSGSVDSLSLSGSNFPGATYPFGLVQLSPILMTTLRIPAVVTIMLMIQLLALVIPI